MTLRTWWRSLCYGLDTVTGLDRKGFFIPYGRAKSVAKPGRYDVVSRAFAEAEPAMEQALDALEHIGPDLLKIEREAKAASGKYVGPRWNQDWFCGLDAAMLYALIRARAPKRIIEIGCGHSTRFATRAIQDGALPTQFIAIDPQPRADLSGLDIRFERSTLQRADMGLFEALDAGDMLFVDSSHILMPGTDVELVLTEILPRLPVGTLVHFHDMFLPEPYPDSWEWRGYNEQSAVAGLMLTGRWQVIFASHYAASRYRDRLAAGPLGQLPAAAGPTTSLWLEKQ
ncbi:MAG TPA: class I SAM-dependent methyltransferase [Dongiaceae bacterium]|nr:class I SAM-dependent methyltransferase [Dongiaceae bacterium]